jgi:DNA-binding NtrC family response regulator
LSKYKLLLAEDEPDILTVITKALGSYGIFEVDPFTDPLVALDHFKNHDKDYDVVVSDMRMPGMSGIEFLKNVKTIRPDMPVVAMTAFDSYDQDIVEAIPSIAKEEIVHKPFKLISVCEAVKKQLHIAI